MAGRVADPERAREVLDSFLRRIDAHEDLASAFALFHDQDVETKLRESEAGLYHRLPLVTAIVETVAPQLAVSPPPAGGWPQLRPTVQMARGLLVDAELRAEILGRAGPQLPGEALHPWVWTAAADLLRQGHNRQAVVTAGDVVFGHLRAQVEAHDDESDAAVVARVWTLAAPEPGRPRLRVGGRTGRSIAADQMARSAGQACAHLLEDLAAPDGPALTADRALELLAVLSVFARLVAEAELHRP